MRSTISAVLALFVPLAAARAETATPVGPVLSHQEPYPRVGSVERLDPALDQLIPGDAKLEVLGEGFVWSEGPLWVKKGGYLLFSDIPTNSIYKWQEGKGISLFMRPSGYDGPRTDLKEPGANGLALDGHGQLVMCQHGRRQLARLVSLAEPAGKQIVVADKFAGKRFNSPNDLVVHSSGDIFFTDPPYGLPDFTDATLASNPVREIPFQGVYRVDGRGQVHLLWKDLDRPNGINLSPDGRTLYVANSSDAHPVWMAFDLTTGRDLSHPRVLFDATASNQKTGRTGGGDGMAVDQAGNLFAAGPGGVLIISPQGRHLGTILTGQKTANCKFGRDGHTLFITAASQLLQVHTVTRGAGF